MHLSIDFCQCSIPILGKDQICGWEALETCTAVTNMRVWLVMLGAIFLLWCHLIWLMSLMVALQAHRDRKAVLDAKHVVVEEPSVARNDSKNQES